MNYKQLPEGYYFKETIDLSENKKIFWTVNGASIIVAVLMVVAGWLICPLNSVTTGWSLMSLIPVAVAIVGYFIYLILHEAVHGVFMFIFSHTKVKFGFKKIYAYAGSKSYFDKKSYIVIGLAPVVLWGIVLAVLNIFFYSGMWFWVIWFIQIGNIGGATGDIYVTYRMVHAPKDVLVQDSGVSMDVYYRGAEQAEEEAPVAAEEAPAEGEND